jgi:hypothetical protein
LQRVHQRLGVHRKSDFRRIRSAQIVEPLSGGKMRCERFAQPVGRKIPVGAFCEHNSTQNTRRHSYFSFTREAQRCHAGRNVISDTLQGTLNNYRNSARASNRAQNPTRHTLYEPMHPRPVLMPESAQIVPF